MYKSLATFAFVVFLFQVFNVELERSFFTNELMVFVGAFFFFAVHAAKPGREEEKYIRFLLVYGALYIPFSYLFLKQGNNYQFFRTMPLWYSVFAFYAGLEVLKRVRWLKKKSVPLAVVFPLALLALFFGQGRAVVLLFPLLLFRNRNWLLLTLVLIGLWGGGGTGVVALGFVLLYWLAGKWLVFRKLLMNKGLIYFSVVAFFVTLVYYYYADSNYYQQQAYERSEIQSEGEEANNTWRIMFWAFEFNYNFLTHPIFGIGYGTELYPKIPETRFIFASNSPDEWEDIQYTHGTHNFVLFVLVRQGLAGFIPMLLIYMGLFRKYARLDKRKRTALQEASFVTFVLMTITAFFNVVLGSPLYSGVYWFTMGLFYQSLQTAQAHESQSIAVSSSSASGSRSLDREPEYGGQRHSA